MKKKLAGKVAVITGASQGLGQHLAICLAREGASVVAAARNTARLDDLVASITRSGGAAVAVTADVTDEDQCRAIVDTALAEFGRIDILVLNAGFATYGSLEEMQSFAPIRDALEVNFYGAAMPTFHALDELIRTEGRIVYVTSGSGHLPLAGYLGYTTSKHAMNGFFEALRLEVQAHGVNVTAINPGDMYSDDGAGRTVFGPDGNEYKIDLSVKRVNDIKRHPASEVAAACVEGIVARRREIDLSPPIQKLATKVRPLLPTLIDRRILERATTMRSAFDDIAAEEHRAQHPDSEPDCTMCRRLSGATA